MKTLWERLEPWFIPVAAVTRFLAPADITAMSCFLRHSTRHAADFQGKGAWLVLAEVSR